MRIERLRTTALDDVTDLDAAYALARIAWTELEAFGTSGGQRLDDDEIALLLRSLTGVLRRLKTPLELPFRDFKSFKSFWKQQGMSDSYEARRSYLGRIFEPVLKKLDAYHPHLAPGRVSSHRITEVTRRRLREGLPTAWWGTLDELQFLERLYDLNNLPSLDPKHVTAAEDIGHHCILDPEDWEADWIWRDERFALADGDDELLRFLAEMLHPAVRTDADEVERLRAWMNETLAHDGYELTAVDTISGAPVFTARTVGSGVSGAMKNLFFAADGPKPEFVLGDAINNDVLLVKNGEFCLQYDQALGAATHLGRLDHLVAHSCALPGGRNRSGRRPRTLQAAVGVASPRSKAARMGVPRAEGVPRLLSALPDRRDRSPLPRADPAGVPAPGPANPPGTRRQRQRPRP
ncbi:hypothetical protein ACFQ51_53850 [Streptomyces kaempferi]